MWHFLLLLFHHGKEYTVHRGGWPCSSRPLHLCWVGLSVEPEAASSWHHMVAEWLPMLIWEQRLVKHAAPSELWWYSQEGKLAMQLRLPHLEKVNFLLLFLGIEKVSQSKTFWVLRCFSNPKCILGKTNNTFSQYSAVATWLRLLQNRMLLHCAY